jgi:hypothetical protein
VMCSGQPYQYKMNRKKRAVAEREGLESDEEEVEDLRATGKIEDILRTTYKMKTRGHRSDAKEGSPFHIRLSMEPTTPCGTKTYEEEKPINQQEISGRRIFTKCGSSGNSSRSVSSTSSSQVSTLCRIGSTTNFIMAGQDQTIRLPEF